MKDKKSFENPTAEIILFAGDDIIVTSAGVGDSAGQGIFDEYED